MDVLGTYKDKPVILQSEPQRRTLSCIHINNQLHFIENTYFLQFPYIIFCQYPFFEHYLRIGLSPEPINSLDAKIYLPPLPNVQYLRSSFTICGCQEDDLKMSIGQFWQKSFATGETSIGEKELCKMFGMQYDMLSRNLSVDIAFRQW
jgi:hypothetical protein